MRHRPETSRIQVEKRTSSLAVASPLLLLSAGLRRRQQRPPCRRVLEARTCRRTTVSARQCSVRLGPLGAQNKSSVPRSCTIDVNLSARSQQLVFFGGKGGVGKTSSSAAYAAGLADQGQRTLLLSTDPAHSLGDALCEDLSGKPREIADNLWAAEVDPSEAIAELRDGLNMLDAKALLDDLGLPGGTTAALGLNELSELLESPPPGVDELAAIARVAAESEGYDVIVFDTAPTGHTLRMLDVPTFLGGFIDKALSIRKSVGGILGMFGLGGDSDKINSALDEAEIKVQTIRARIAWLADALKTAPGKGQTTAEFVVVTRPTALDCDEAARLAMELRRQGVCCRRMIVNQVVNPDTTPAYWTSRVSAQSKVLDKLRTECAARSLPMLEVPDMPETFVGVPALSYLASLAYGEQELPETEVVLFGGKGGVGKTSMSSAYAVRAANAGKRVLAISTDPAHSLGDALGMQLGEQATQVDAIMGSGELWALEVNTGAAMQRFQDTVRAALANREQGGGLVGEVLKQLPMEDFVSLFDTLPPGSDEIVALVEVLEEIKKAKYDQIIIDTAPTGHALRLLSFPDFLERLADRVARLRDRFGWLAGGDDGPDRLRSFQFKMIELQDLFTDADRTSFAAVAIPTVLALEETRRLMEQLKEQDIRLGVVIANRILDADRAQDGITRLLQTQQTSLQALDTLASSEDLSVTRIPYLDQEVRGIYGLRYFSTNIAEVPA